MKKIIAIAIAASLILGIGYYFYRNNQQKVTSAGSEPSNIITPSRIPEINGTVIDIQGNELIIANEVGRKELSAEEKAARQKLSPEERQALKTAESANITKENVTITIPVGVEIVKGSGDGSGTNIKAQLADIIKGSYVSIWKTGDIVEMVKLKGVSGE